MHSFDPLCLFFSLPFILSTFPWLCLPFASPSLQSASPSFCLSFLPFRKSFIFHPFIVFSCLSSSPIIYTQRLRVKNRQRTKRRSNTPTRSITPTTPLRTPLLPPPPPLTLHSGQAVKVADSPQILFNRSKSSPVKVTN